MPKTLGSKIKLVGLLQKFKTCHFPIFDTRQFSLGSNKKNHLLKLQHCSRYLFHLWLHLRHDNMFSTFFSHEENTVKYKRLRGNAKRNILGNKERHCLQIIQ